MKRMPTVFAGPCPRNSSHSATRVYKTNGEVRYCKCNQCGKTWKRTAEPHEDNFPLVDYAISLAESIEETARVDGAVQIPDALAHQIVKDLRDLAS